MAVPDTSSRFGILVGPGVVRDGAIDGAARVRGRGRVRGRQHVGRQGRVRVGRPAALRHRRPAGARLRAGRPGRRRRPGHERARSRRGHERALGGPGRGRRPRACRPEGCGGDAGVAARHARAPRALHGAGRGVRSALRHRRVGAGPGGRAGGVTARGRPGRRRSPASSASGSPAPSRRRCPAAWSSPPPAGPSRAWQLALDAAATGRHVTLVVDAPPPAEVTAGGVAVEVWGDGSVDLDPSALVAVAGDIVAWR